MPRFDWLREFLPARIKHVAQRAKREHDARLSCNIEQLEERILLTSYIVDTLEDEGTGARNGELSLREALIAVETNAAFGDARAGEAGGDIISFRESLGGSTITLTNGFFAITEQVKVSGPSGGITINADSRGRIFRISSPDNVVLENMTLTGGRSGSVGGAVLMSGTGELRLNNITMTANRTTGTGGAGLYSVGSPLRITGSTFSANVAQGSDGTGGGIFANGGRVRITNTTFDRNIAGKSGGGLQVTDGISTLTNVDFTRNSSRFGGGLHMSDKGDLTYSGGTVNANTATTQGGGIWNQLGAKLFVSNVSITTNISSGSSATGGGGGIYNAGGNVRLTGGSITGNSADGALGNGGGLFSVSGNVVASNLTFGGNTAMQAGGAIEVLSGNVNLQNVMLGDGITGNNANVNGGGLHVGDKGARVVLVGGMVGSNTAGEEGGGLWNQAGSEIILRSGTILSGNSASGANINQGGGAIYNEGGTVVSNGVTFTTNAALGALGSGGAILSKLGRLELANTLFTNNRASRAGGAVAAVTATLRITGSQFGGPDNITTTVANLADSGGAIYIHGKSNSVIESSSFANNTANVEGGAIWNGGGNRLVVRANSSFNTNFATGNARHDGGGAIFNGGTLRIDSSSFTANEANGTLGSGGALFLSNGSTLITGTTISANIANRAGGGIEVGTGNLIFRNSLLGSFFTGGNVAGPNADGAPGNGGGLHVTGTNADVVIDNSQVTGNTAASEGGGLWNARASKLTVIGGSIDTNIAAGDDATNGGGGIFNNGGQVRLETTLINANQASGLSGSGGGVFSTNGSVVANNTVFTSNTANRAGGGIEVIGGRVFLRNSTLGGTDASLGNVAGPLGDDNPGNGGGLHVSGRRADVTIKGGSVQNNVAAAEGGGLWNQDNSKLETIDVLITQNTAQGDQDGGAGIFNNGGDLRLVNTNIVENIATGDFGQGGGIYSVDGDIVAVNLVVRSNMANRSGAGIQIETGNVDIRNSRINRNTTGVRDAAPGDGGGIHVSESGARVELRGSNLTLNFAAGSGGGIWLADGSTLVLRSTDIVRNTAQGTGARQGGGGVFSDGGTVGGTIDARNAKFINNTAERGQGGGILTSQGGNATIRSSEFRGNTTTLNGGGIYNAGTHSVNGTKFIGNRSINGGGYFTAPTGTTSGSGNLFVRNIPNQKN